MKLPLQITFRDMEPSEAVKKRIEAKANKLERIATEITSCRVTIEAPHKHHQKGRLYNVAVDITLPGKEIVCSSGSKANHAYEDVYVAIRDTFNAASKQLEAFIDKRRRDVKTHERPTHGRVKHIESQQDYGIIETLDGREIYFHRNSILGSDFNKLSVGADVHFSEEQGEKGPQASTVHVEGKHHVI